ncbi:class I SAM-dependent methyltransferase [Rhodoplanes sp. Z2-YC6860]|uniref:class I SAM-dependent methyltransferase n=1 Tax=Rhodoplanes sp. Z2-YC6860 TaxID=674703 RepID=UPI00078E3C74|nr:class I SAM-dependent methyltransferase [Rhodoplanes sp. Z2-YC6860]AMN43433.1 methyltransferase type 12 [Rhodoplanes sp. Z2-YC6860]
MKAFGLKVANVLALIWQLLPMRLRHLLLKGMFVLESRGPDTGAALKRLFTLQDDLDHVVNERAMIHGKGEHPKHRLMRYHDFFIGNISDGQRVIDIGCGYGAVARSIARARPKSQVIGVDYDPKRLAEARARDNPANLSFVEADATQAVPQGPWDVVVLSNVLEHIVDRHAFLTALIDKTKARRFLIRVPLFERDWRLAMRREVGANYYSDPDHEIEPTQEEFRRETAAAGLVVEQLGTPWGEIWSVLRVSDSRA